MKNLKLAAVLLCATAMAPTTAFGQDISVSTGVDYVTEYVFRGVAFAGTAVQPYAEASIGDFTVGAWSSTGIGEDSAVAGDEIDIYVGYSVPLESFVSLDVGATYYHFPDSGSFFSTDGGSAGSYEVYAAAGLSDVALSPTLTAYYDLTLDSFTLTGDVGHSFAFGGSQSLDLGLTLGLVDVEDGSYEWATAGAALSHGFTDDVSAYVGANFSISSEDSLDFEAVNVLDADGAIIGTEGITTSDNKFWVGVGISAGF